MFSRGVSFLNQPARRGRMAMVGAFVLLPAAAYFAAHAVGEQCYVCLNNTVDACDCSTNGPCLICLSDGYCDKIFTHVCAQTYPHMARQNGAFLKDTQVPCWIRYYCGPNGNGTCSYPSNCIQSTKVYSMDEQLILTYHCEGTCTGAPH